MSTVQNVRGREVLDSRGNPTIEVDVSLKDGSLGTAMVPSGASVGTFEAVERRDGDLSRFGGKGVLQAVASINREINTHLIGLDAVDQSRIDQTLLDLDGTENKARLGANAILGVSLAVLDAAAKSRAMPLYQHVNNLFGNVEMRMPVPLVNVLNGGEHADNPLKFQEFMIVPVGGDSFAESLRMAAEIFQSLKEKLKSSKPPLSTAVGDEGGFAPHLSTDKDALEFLDESVKAAGYRVNEDCCFALDCAASEFYASNSYEIEDDVSLSGQQLVEHFEKLIQQYPGIVSIEDGCDEEAWDHWHLLYQTLGQSVQLVGDDLFVTNMSRLKRGITEKSANSILVKLNQVGSVTETLDAIGLAKDHGITTVVSHRSGDTEDTKIADIAVGTGAGQIKTGSMSRSERVAKYNRLLRIEEELDSIAYRGKEEFQQFRG